MTAEETRSKVLQVLGKIAPEADRESIDPHDDLREQFDLDSMDFLNFALGLNEVFGLDVPERDYPKMATLDGCVTYLLTHAPAAAPR